MAVEVEWCGHSYLLVRWHGATIAVDPHDGGSVGVETCKVKADYVLVTHDHFDHNAVTVASGPGTRVVKWRTGSFKLGEGVSVEGYRFYHDKASGRLRGTVVAYKVEVGGVRVVHLSDIGHVPPREALEPLRGADLLAVPVGGVYTIDAVEAVDLVEALQPRLVLPIHYWVEGVILPLDPLDRFLSHSRFRRARLDGRTVPLEPGGAEGRPTILIPRPPRSLWTAGGGAPGY